MRTVHFFAIRRSLVKGLGVLALVASAQICNGTVIYTDESSGYNNAEADPIGTLAGGGYNQTQWAIEVIPTASALAGSVDLWGESNGTSNEITIEIAANTGGVPGTILASQTEAGVIPQFGPMATITFSNPITLNAGTPYWVILSGPNLTNLEYYSYISNITASSNGNSGALDEKDAGINSGNWFQYGAGNIMPTFDLTTQTATPEPGTFVSASFVLFFLAGFTFWRKRTQSGERI